MFSLRQSLDNSGSITMRSLATDNQMPDTFTLKQLAVTEFAKRRYSELGGQLSPLGRPVQKYAQVFPGKPGIAPDFALKFAAGEIGFPDSATPASTTKSLTTVIRRRVRIRYRGLYCENQADDSMVYPANEPYLTIGVYPVGMPDRKKVHQWSYDDVESHEYRTADEEIWNEEPPDDLIIIATLMEHDSGNKEEVKEKMAEYLEAIAGKAAELGAAALGVPYVESEELNQLIRIASLGLADLTVSVLGMGDDHMGTHVQTISLGTMLNEWFDAQDNPHTPEIHEHGPIKYNMEGPDFIDPSDYHFKIYYFCEPVKTIEVHDSPN